jgi:photosystem II stability/assembly factor-like uncharacterized protein
MKRHALRLAVAVVTFAIGVAGVWIAFHRPRPHRSAAAKFDAPAPAANLPPVSRLPKIGDVPKQIGKDSKVSLQFVNANDGWLSIDGDLFRTEDGGKTWESIEFPRFATGDGFEPSLSQFQLIDPKRAWLVSENRLYHTTDGGRNWNQIRQPITQFFTDYASFGLRKAFFLKDERHGWVTGDIYRWLSRKERENGTDQHSDYSPDGRRIVTSMVYFTDDGGVTWSARHAGFNGMFALDETHIWAYDGVVYRVVQNNWDAVNADPNIGGVNSRAHALDYYCGSGCDIPTSVFFLNAQLGWVANSDNYLARSFDGGKTWVDVALFPGEGLGPNMYGVKVHFDDEDTGWALDKAGKLLRSDDGGVSWAPVDDHLVFYDICFLDAKNRWAVSPEGTFRVPEETRPY